jgi:hypothetical protein
MAANILNVDVDIIFGAPPLRAQGFNVAALVRDGISLNGARFKDYTSADALAADLTAGYIDQYTHDTGVRVLGLRPRVPKFRVLKVKTTAPENELYATVVTNFLATADGAETFALCLDVDTPATAALVAAVVAAYPKLKLLQATTNDSDPLTTYAALLPFRCFTLDYDVDNIAAYNKGMVGLCARLAYDQNRRSPNFTGGIDGIAVSSASITQAALDTLIANNVNVYAPRAPEAVYRYAGRQFTGLPTSVYVHAAWLQQRFDEAISQLIVNYDRQGFTLPVSAAGQDICISELRAVVEQAVELRKVQPGQAVFTKPAITNSDLSTQTIPIEADVQMTTPAAKVVVTLRVSQQPVVEE